MDNRAYTQFDDNRASPTPRYANGSIASGQISTSPDVDGAAKDGKKWKNSRRLCWILLILSVITLILEIAGAGVAGAYLEWLLGRFVAGVWLAALGVISSGVGLLAFPTPSRSSRCWSITHFVMCIISTVSYGILLLLAISDVIRAREAMNDFYEVYYGEEQESVEESSGDGEGVQNSTAAVEVASANSTTPSSTDTELNEAIPVFNALKGDLTIGVFLLGTTVAFFIISIIANILICRTWCKNKKKTMTIVYMPQDQTGNAQTHSIVIPSKTQVVVIPTTRPDHQQEQKESHYRSYNGI